MHYVCSENKGADQLCSYNAADLHHCFRIRKKQISSDAVSIYMTNLSCVMRKQTFWFPIRSDTNQAIQLQKMARGLKFRIYKVEGLYYLYHRAADLRLCFRICKMLVFSRRGSFDRLS